MAADDQNAKQKLQREIAVLSAAINSHKMNTRQKQQFYPNPNGMSWRSKSVVPSHPYKNQGPKKPDPYSVRASTSSAFNKPSSLLNASVSRTKIVKHTQGSKQSCVSQNPKHFHVQPAQTSQFKVDKRQQTTQLDSGIFNTKRTLSGISKTVVHNSASSRRKNDQGSYKINRTNCPRLATTDAATFVNRVMGRSVKNATKNKFKFVKQRSRPVVLSRSSLRIDRRSSTPRSRHNRRRSSLAIVNGRVVKSSPRPATPIGRLVSPTRIRNTPHRPDSTPVRLGGMKIDRRSRVSSSSFSVNTSRGSQRMAQSVLQRSRQIAMKATRKKVNTDKKYCTFYNRFGVCNRGEKCPFIHDKTKVAVCRRFILGKCPMTDCPFSHHLNKEKMPVCSYFLRGLCTKDECPYSHVNVNREAQVCQAFLDGYCSLGSKCLKKHTHLCQAYVTKGECPDRAKCKLKHPAKRRRKSTKAKREKETSKDEPLQPGQMPSFIRLDSDESFNETSNPASEKPSTTGLKIRPVFGN